MENSRLASSVVILAFLLSGLAALFCAVGRGLFLEHLLVGVVALASWLWWSATVSGRRPASIVPYILSIVALLVLDAVRYRAGYPAYVAAHYAELFTPRFVLSGTNWFLVAVCAPVCLLLGGGYFLSRCTTLGYFFAWWGFSYCLAEALGQFRLELGNGAAYPHYYFLGLGAAMVLFYTAATGLLSLLKPAGPAVAASPPTELSSRQINLWSALFVGLVVIYGSALYREAGLLPVGVIAGSMMGGMLGWRKTTARVAADPYQVVPLYLLLQALFYFHVGEEALTGFNRGIAAISGVAWSDQDFTFFIAFLGPIIWVFGAYSLWKRQPFGNFVLWFMMVGMLLGEPTHLLVFPVVRMVKEHVGYEYFSGMYTALFPMIPAILALATILKNRQPATTASHARPLR
ncbi:MAG: hypothetical protein ACRYFX_08240 [Janthinobacterium lividum]